MPPSAYVQRQYEVRLNLTNLVDKVYYVGGYNNSPNRVLPGYPRALRSRFVTSSCRCCCAFRRVDHRRPGRPSFDARIDAGRWVDGNVTSGHQSAQAKYNEQLPEDSEEAKKSGEEIVAALGKSPLFFSAALPKQVYPPLFNRYQGEMSFGSHVDSAMRVHAPTGRRIRTDISATLFLTDPNDYDGGELLVEDTYGVHSVKLPAGDMVIYPATSLHRVTPITRGMRVSSFFWIESMIRDDAQRSLLFDMDMALVRLNQHAPGHASLIRSDRLLSQPVEDVGRRLIVNDRVTRPSACIVNANSYHSQAQIGLKWVVQTTVQQSFGSSRAASAGVKNASIP